MGAGIKVLPSVEGKEKDPGLLRSCDFLKDLRVRPWNSLRVIYGEFAEMRREPGKFRRQGEVPARLIDETGYAIHTTLLVRPADRKIKALFYACPPDGGQKETPPGFPGGV
jgi:hypothetical protein